MVDLKAAAIAANRFGFGAKPGELGDIAPDPRSWLKAQLARPTQRAVEMRSPSKLAAFFQAQKEKKTDIELAKMFKQQLREDFKAEAAQRTIAAAASPTPFLERLTQFWSNHFTVSIQRPVVIPVAIGFENEAVRPHVMGRFRDMLRAVAQHPAMLLYLDNAVSVGPDSLAGRIKDKGLNENLARELLELHTVGVDGGYTQGDVTEFAKILTGWSINRAGEGEPGTFRWRPMIHEPGEKSLLGKRYNQAAWRRDWRPSMIWPLGPRPRATSQPSSRAISSPTSRPTTRSASWLRSFARAVGISGKHRWRLSTSSRSGANRSPR